MHFGWTPAIWNRRSGYSAGALLFLIVPVVATGCRSMPNTGLKKVAQQYTYIVETPAEAEPTSVAVALVAPLAKKLLMEFVASKLEKYKEQYVDSYEAKFVTARETLSELTFVHGIRIPCNRLTAPAEDQNDKPWFSEAVRTYFGALVADNNAKIDPRTNDGKLVHGWYVEGEEKMCQFVMSRLDFSLKLEDGEARAAPRRLRVWATGAFLPGWDKAERMINALINKDRPDKEIKKLREKLGMSIGVLAWVSAHEPGSDPEEALLSYDIHGIWPAGCRIDEDTLELDPAYEMTVSEGDSANFKWKRVPGDDVHVRIKFFESSKMKEWIEKAQEKLLEGFE